MLLIDNKVKDLCRELDDITFSKCNTTNQCTRITDFTHFMMRLESLYVEFEKDPAIMTKVACVEGFSKFTESNLSKKVFLPKCITSVPLVGSRAMWIKTTLIKIVLQIQALLSPIATEAFECLFKQNLPHSACHLWISKLK
jgi:hypothetical protein